MPKQELGPQRGFSGTDMNGRMLVFVAGPPKEGVLPGESPDDLLDQAIALEQGAQQVNGDASVAMLIRSEELFAKAVELGNGVIFDRRANGLMGETQITDFQL